MVGSDSFTSKSIQIDGWILNEYFLGDQHYVLKFGGIKIDFLNRIKSKFTIYIYGLKALISGFRETKNKKRNWQILPASQWVLNFIHSCDIPILSFFKSLQFLLLS